MKKIYRSTFWFLTLPQAILAFCAAYQMLYNYSLALLCTLVAALAAGIFFTAYTIAQKNNPQTLFYIIMAAVFTVLIAAAVPLLEDTLMGGIISIRLIAILTCAVPLIYSLFGLVSVSKKGDIVKFLVGLVFVPLAFFLAFNAASGINASTAVMIVIIACAYTAIFLIAKIVIFRKDGKIFGGEKQRPRYIVLYAIFSIALPLVGLTLNVSMGNLLGDFSDPAFYIVVIINGILQLVTIEDRRLRLLRFFLMAAAALYFIYFFIVFLPYIPLGLAALIYIAGVLLFAPAGALVMQIIYLVREWPEVVKLWDIKRTLAVFIAGLFVLPACVLTSFIGDKNNLDAALSYVNDIPANEESVDIERLRRAVDNAGSVYEFDSFIRGVEVDKNTPIISSIYSSLVLGGTVIPQQQMNALRQIFFDNEGDEEWNSGWERPADAAITAINTNTKYDEEAGAYRTWVDLTLQGASGSDNGEYSTLFCLPEGAYITNYYLDVSGERKLGILADDRAATQIYEKIITKKRDPGLLHYIGDNTLELRVFPFSGNEIRRTGFEIIHCQQASFILDGKTVELPAQSERGEVAVNGAVMISARLKETLPQLKARALKYYFIIDCSAGSDIEYQLSQIREYANINAVDNASVLFTSYRVVETRLKEAGKASIIPESGFNLALAVRKILKENGDDTVPVLLFTSDNAYDAYYPAKISALAKRYPEMGCYYEVNDDMTLTPYSFENNEKYTPVQKPAAGRILSYHGIPVLDDGKSELVYTGEAPVLGLNGGQYEDAVSIEASAETARTLDLIRASFRAHVLTDKTAFIVVETRQQEEELYELQESILSADASSARITLDEPPVLLCIIAAALVIITTAAMKRLKRVKEI